ncbi:MAG: mechanosensitive ion channel [Rubrivivax sp.]|jgi:small-conductance mechanosensitive channel|nr:mechanosensitive ion channel [Rubrivivax sp.]
MAKGHLTADELGRLGTALLQPSALIEVAVLAACVGAAWLLARAAHGPSDRPRSIWLGRRPVDGLLFPLLALLFALLARWGLAPVLPIVVLRIAVPVLLALLVVRFTVRVLRAAFPSSTMVRAVERWVSWIAWVAMVLWVLGVLPLLLQEMEQLSWAFGGSRVSLRDVLEGTVAAVVTLVGALWLSSALEQKLLAGATDNLSVRKMAANALRAVLLFLGLIFALTAAGIDLTALGVLGGALGVGIGFGLQKLAANYVSGFVILAERSMRIGDIVRVDNFEGRITDITTRYTVIRALNGRESIVPNELLITSRVENSSLADPKVLISTIVQVAYGTDLDRLMPHLVGVVRGVPRVLDDPGPAVQLSNFAADGLELTVLFWISDPENGQGNVRSAVNLAILRELNAAGVEIPYPQRVVRGLPAG